MPKCDLFKAYNSNEIWLDNKLGKDFMPLNNLSKFTDNPIKNIKVREQKTVKCQKWTNSRAITQ